MQYLLLILLFLVACTKETSVCEQWQVEVFEMKGMLCPTGRIDTVTVCWNGKEREDIAGSFKKVDSVNYHRFLKPLK